MTDKSILTHLQSCSRSILLSKVSSVQHETWCIFWQFVYIIWSIISFEKDVNMDGLLDTNILWKYQHSSRHKSKSVIWKYWTLLYWYSTEVGSWKLRFTGCQCVFDYYKYAHRFLYPLQWVTLLWKEAQGLKDFEVKGIFSGNREADSLFNESVWKIRQL